MNSGVDSEGEGRFLRSFFVMWGGRGIVLVKFVAGSTLKV